jgi:hypothetical protein
MVMLSALAKRARLSSRPCYLQREGDGGVGRAPRSVFGRAWGWCWRDWVWGCPTIPDLAETGYGAVLAGVPPASRRPPL